MKKNVLITYFNNGDFKDASERHAMLNKVTKDLEREGKELNMESHFTFGSISTFTDGSQITVMSVEELAKDNTLKDVSDIYASETIIGNPSTHGVVIGKMPSILSDKTVKEFELGDRNPLKVYSIRNRELQVSE